MPADERQIVGELIAPHRRVAGQENTAAKEAETLHVESRPARVSGVHIELVHVPLQA